ncbi:Ribonuclease H-like domain [Phytophthora cactorum]|nr:Ribonuclease H-like domain [Phytophthora cactorum]
MDAFRLSVQGPHITVAPDVTVTPATYIVLAFDGGARSSPQQRAHTCCVWSNAGSLLWWAARAVYNSGTGNEMEVHGLLNGLQRLRRQYRNTSTLRSL